MKSRYDCILMLSGGKDSSYLAYLLEQEGKRPLAITIDVGFMSDHAKSNIERLKDDLHLDHLWIKSQQDRHAKLISEFREQPSMGLPDICGSCTLLIMQTVFSIASSMGVTHLFCGYTKYSAFTTSRKAQIRFPGGFIYDNPYMDKYNLPKMEEFLLSKGFVVDPSLTNCHHIREIIIRHTQRFGVNPYEGEFKALLDAKQILPDEVKRLRAWCTAKPNEFPDNRGDETINDQKEVAA